MIVLDASAAVEVLLGLPCGAPRLRAHLAQAGETVHVPHVFDLDVVAVIRRHASWGSLRRSRAHRPRRSRRPPGCGLLAPSAEAAALAEALGAPLVTVDAALAQAPGLRADVELHASA